jgi:hypothetical protein
MIDLDFVSRKRALIRHVPKSHTTGGLDVHVPVKCSEREVFENVQICGWVIKMRNSGPDNAVDDITESNLFSHRQRVHNATRRYGV